ncbi:unnamed protein product [Musa banksii]
MAGAVSALFLLDIKGRILIWRDYRGDVSAVQAERFFTKLIEKEGDIESRSPVVFDDGISYMFIQHNNVFLMTAARQNCNVASILLFLHRVVNVFKHYFEELEEESLRDNFVVVYELLDEIMDFGYPQYTEAKILSEFIKTDAYRMEVVQRPPMAVTNAVSWRSEGIWYKKNEVFLDVVESVNILVNSNGQIIRSEVVGALKMRTYLSGMPECKLGLNDRLLLETQGRTTKGKAIDLDDIKFHQCVRLSRFENDRTISFIPPDGSFDLMTYRLSTQVKPPVWVEAQVEKHSRSRIEILVKARSQFKERSTATNVEIELPVPSDAINPNVRTSMGSAKYAPENDALVWKIKSFPGGKEYMCRAEFSLPSITAEEATPEKKAPIRVKFEIPYFTVSGIQRKLRLNPLLPLLQTRLCHHLHLLSHFRTLKRRLAAGGSLRSPKSFKSYAETCASLLRLCSADGHLSALGLALHGHALRAGVSSDRSVSSKLLAMYALAGHPADRDLFLAERCRPPDLFSRNLMVAYSARSGDLATARLLFDGMPDRNAVTWTLMVDGHMKRGSVGEAAGYFERCPYKTVICFTAYISGFVLNGLHLDALVHFRRMLASGLMPNEVTFTCVLKACVGAGEFELGKSVVGLIVKTNFDGHVSVQNSLITLYLRMGDVDVARTVFDQMEERDVVSWTAILDVYAQMGDLKEARRIFEEMPERNEVSWSTMIARYGQSGEALEAINLFRFMLHDGQRPNVSCLASAISASSGCENLLFGSGVHCHALKVGFETDVFVGSSLIDMYCKCKDVADGRRVFDLIPEKNIVCWNSMVAGYSCNDRIEEAEELFEAMTNRNIASWNAMISGYAENGRFMRALETFDNLLVSELPPSQMTFSSVLLACATLCSLDKGKNLHGRIVKIGIQHEVFIGTALVDMYAKCGDIESTKRVFHGMPEKNEVSWSAMIQGLADNGFAEESITMFEEMKRAAIAPTDPTFLSVLFACSHCGLVDKGLQYFDSMEEIYGISPNTRHYSCVIDLLARAGHLREAEEIISTMPIKPEANSWAALLSACSTFRDEEIGERVAKRLWELEKENTAGYVLLSNIYASCGRWKDVAKVRTQMRRLGKKKVGGCSSIQIRDQFHTFFSWDVMHPKSSKVYDVLELVMSEMTYYK